MFDNVPSGRPTVFLSNHPDRSGWKNQIAPGDHVTLKIGEERIYVDAVQPIGENRWRGTVRGFEPSFAVEFKGMPIGVDVEFSSDQVWACAEPS